MLAFFVDLDDGESGFHDLIGITCADLAAAKQEAVGLLRQVARDRLAPDDDRTFVAAIRDSSGAVLFRATLDFRCVTSPDGG